MITKSLRLSIFLAVVVWMVSPVSALLTGFNADIHMDIDPTGQTLANDFHVEGIIKSGPIGSGWSKPPVLAMHIDDRFTSFVHVIAPAPDDPDQNTFLFMADWSGAEYRYCEVLHLGLLFDVECHNLVIDLVGWWTFNGQTLPGHNGGRVLIPGFDVRDEDTPQRLQVRNDSGKGKTGGSLVDGINGYLRQMDVIAMSLEQMNEWGSPLRLFEELRLGGDQGELPWVPVVVDQGRPLEGPFPVDSFFDVFFDLEMPEPSWPRPAEPMVIEPGGFLIVRELVEFENNAREPDVRWTWHFHEAHEGRMHDLGDAPDSTNSWGMPMTAYPPVGPPQIQANFPTVYAAGSPPHGPIHWQTQAMHLGPMVTGEIEADVGPDMDGVNNIIPPQDQPDLDMGDDGVIMPLNLQWCQTNNSFQYIVTVNNPIVPHMFVNVWFDWNMDGDWDDTIILLFGLQVPEWAVQNQPVPITGPGVYVFTTPPFAAYWLLGPIDHPTDHIWMRITLAEQPWQPVPGAFGFGGSGPPQGYTYGETEDYLIRAPAGPKLDFGDAPDGPAAPGYPTLAANNGARHMIAGPWLGGANDMPDPEPDGQPDPAALGDDNDGNDDENGVQMPPLVMGVANQILIEVSGGGIVNAWIDFNGDRVWQEPGERIFGGFLPPGIHPVLVTPPPGSVVGHTFGRFRISSQGGLLPTGIAFDGEVEDHEVIIEPMPELDHDFGDAPDDGKLFRYVTLLANDGARHKIDPRVFLGDTIDAEVDGQPTLAADGDDTDAQGDDEDGVKFITWPLRPGMPATIEVKASVAGFLSVWIDFAADGDWTEPADQVFLGLPISAGVNTLVFGVPATAKPNSRTYGRFRFATQPVLSFRGPAADGEVEDYLIKIRQNPGIKWIQRPDVTPHGIDIRLDSGDGVYRVLADDFECTGFGYITDVHLWGSWKDDIKGKITGIRLSIHSDDPVGSGGTLPANNYSQPDELLWQHDFAPGDFVEKLYATVKEGEHWWDPYTDILKMPGDHQIWRVDIRIPRRHAFLQTGSPERPVVYWLDVAVKTEGGEFGWKTRRWPEHFNDDAVMGMVDASGAMVWQELGYPDEHPLHPESLDMAFVITGDDACTGCADLNRDGVVDLGDLAVLAEQYLTAWPFNW